MTHSHELLAVKTSSVSIAAHDLRFEYVPPRWATAHIASHDATFLAALVRELAPSAMVEIGVASGCSSAVLLQALASSRRESLPPMPWLYSFDIAERCCFDPTRRVGDAVDELAPALRPGWHLTTGDALQAGRLLRDRGLSFAFIDADHRHPWPTLDLLAILPALRPGAWVALHDIRLRALGTGPEYDARGAQDLFEAWPWARRVEPREGNMGVIRLEGSRRAIAGVCRRLLDRPWETSVHRDVLAARGLAPDAWGAGFAHSPAQRAIATATRQTRSSGGPARPIVIWGAGRAGRDCLAHLQAAGLTVTAFVDRDPHKRGGRIDGLDVRDPTTLDAALADRPFVMACGLFAAEMAATLDGLGFMAPRDYVVI